MLAHPIQRVHQKVGVSVTQTSQSAKLSGPLSHSLSDTHWIFNRTMSKHCSDFSTESSLGATNGYIVSRTPASAFSIRRFPTECQGAPIAHVL
jgi:hypothetical protein